MQPSGEGYFVHDTHNHVKESAHVSNRDGHERIGSLLKRHGNKPFVNLIEGRYQYITLRLCIYFGFLLFQATCRPATPSWHQRVEDAQRRHRQGPDSHQHARHAQRAAVRAAEDSRGAAVQVRYSWQETNRFEGFGEGLFAGL
jgi:hypothetical protein